MADGDGKLKTGPAEAAAILNALGDEAKNRIMGDIEKRDPKMAKLIDENLVSFNDLVYLTPKMIMEFLREVKMDTFAMALRLGSEELRQHIFKNISSSMRKEIEETLNGPPRPVSEVQDAVQTIMKTVIKLHESGEIILKDDDTLV
jgi:flagellar motor switch protein FliG